MNERDDSIRIDEGISSDVSQRVRSVISAAESAATAIRHEAEQQAQAARRMAEQERLHYLEDARREADRLLSERIERIRDLSDDLIEGAETVLMRIGGAQEVKRQLETLVHSLSATAEQLAREREEVRGAVSGFEGRPEPAAPAPREPAAAEPPLREPEPVAAEPDLPEPEPEPAAPVAEIEPDPREREPESEPEALEPRDPHPLYSNGDEAVVDHARGDELLGPRLVALQMAVAGGRRGEVEDHLRRAFDLPECERILDDVFGAGTDAEARVAWPDVATGGG